MKGEHLKCFLWILPLNFVQKNQLASFIFFRRTIQIKLS